MTTEEAITIVRQIRMEMAANSYSVGHPATAALYDERANALGHALFALNCLAGLERRAVAEDGASEQSGRDER